MTECKPISIPINSRAANFLLFYKENINKKIIKWYQLAIGSPIWPDVYTCPNIIYAMRVFGQYCKNPGLINCNLIIQIFKYLFKILDFRISFTANSKNKLVDYIDFDYTRLIDNQKFISNYIFMLSGKLLSYQSKLQSTVILLSCEAGYMAITEVKKEAL